MTYIHSFSHIHTIHLSVTIRSYAQWETPPCGAEPRIELEPALQQADALPNEPRRTLFLPHSFITAFYKSWNINLSQFTPLSPSFFFSVHIFSWYFYSYQTDKLSGFVSLFLSAEKLNSYQRKVS